MRLKFWEKTPELIESKPEEYPDWFMAGDFWGDDMTRKVHATLCVRGDRIKWVDFGDGEKKHAYGDYLVTGVCAEYTDDPNSPTFERMFKDKKKPEWLPAVLMAERILFSGILGAVVVLLYKAIVKR